MGILLGALLLRLVNIVAQPYWGDEVLSLDIVKQFPQVPEMLRYLSQVEFHPPLYYVLLHYWTHAFGESTFGTRSLSLIFSVASVAMAWLLGKRILRSSAAGLYAATIVAVLPIQIQFAQEARPYSLFCFLAEVAALALWEHLRTRDKRWFGAYCLATIAGLWLHYSFFFVLAATSGWWFIAVLRAPAKERWTAFKWFLAAHTIVFLGFYPWLVFMLYKIGLGKFDFMGASRNSYPYRGPDLFEILLGQLLWMTKAKYMYIPEILGAVLFKIAFVGFAAAAVARRAKGQTHDGATDESFWFLGWMFAVPLTLFIASPQSLPYSAIYMRHVIFVTVPAALLIAWVMSALPAKKAAVLLSLFLISQITYVATVLENDALWDQDYRLQEAGEYISDHYKPGDLVVVSVSIVRTDLSHYLRQDMPVAVMLPIPYYDGADVWATRHTLGLVENESQVRITRPSETQIKEKLDELNKIYHPKRIWLYAFANTDLTVHHWFMDRHWRHAFSSIGNIFLVDLYSEK